MSAEKAPMDEKDLRISELLAPYPVKNVWPYEGMLTGTGTQLLFTASIVRYKGRCSAPTDNGLFRYVLV